MGHIEAAGVHNILVEVDMAVPIEYMGFDLPLVANMGQNS